MDSPFFLPLLTFQSHPRGLINYKAQFKFTAPSTDNPSFIDLSSNIDQVMAGKDVSDKSVESWHRPEEEVSGNNVCLLPPGVSVPLGDTACNVIVELADPTAQVPDHVHRTSRRVTVDIGVRLTYLGVR